jgi:hypothetical protein
MTLQASGAIKFSEMQTEFGGSNPISMTEYYGEGTLPSSGTIKASDFYGQSSAPPNALSASGLQLFTSVSTQTGNWLWMNAKPIYNPGGNVSTTPPSGWTRTIKHNDAGDGKREANLWFRYGSAPTGARLTYSGSVTSQLPIIGLNPTVYTPVSGSSIGGSGYLSGGIMANASSESSRRPISNIPAGLYAVYWSCAIAKNTGKGLESSQSITIHPSGATTMTAPTTAFQSTPGGFSGGAFIMSVGSTTHISVGQGLRRPIVMTAVSIQ